MGVPKCIVLKDFTMRRSFVGAALIAWLALITPSLGQDALHPVDAAGSNSVAVMSCGGLDHLVCPDGYICVKQGDEQGYVAPEVTGVCEKKDPSLFGQPGCNGATPVVVKPGNPTATTTTGPTHVVDTVNGPKEVVTQSTVVKTSEGDKVVNTAVRPAAVAVETGVPSRIDKKQAIKDDDDDDSEFIGFRKVDKEKPDEAPYGVCGGPEMIPCPKGQECNLEGTHRRAWGHCFPIAPIGEELEKKKAADRTRQEAFREKNLAQAQLDRDRAIERDAATRKLGSLCGGPSEIRCPAGQECFLEGSANDAFGHCRDPTNHCGDQGIPTAEYASRVVSDPSRISKFSTSSTLPPLPPAVGRGVAAARGDVRGRTVLDGRAVDEEDEEAGTALRPIASTRVHTRPQDGDLAVCGGPEDLDCPADYRCERMSPPGDDVDGSLAYGRCIYRPDDTDDPAPPSILNADPVPPLSTNHHVNTPKQVKKDLEDSSASGGSSDSGPAEGGSSGSSDKSSGAASGSHDSSKAGSSGGDSKGSSGGASKGGSAGASKAASKGASKPAGGASKGGKKGKGDGADAHHRYEKTDAPAVSGAPLTETVDAEPDQSKSGGESSKPPQQQPEKNPSAESASPLEEKPKEDKPQEEKPKEDKPQEEKPKEDKPQEEKPKEDKPQEEKPKEDKPQEEKPKEDKPQEEKPKEDKPQEEKPKEEKPVDSQWAKSQGGDVVSSTSDGSWTPSTGGAPTSSAPAAPSQPSSAPTACSHCGRHPSQCTCNHAVTSPACSQCGHPAHECNCGRPHELAQDRVCSQCGHPAHECTCGRPHDLAQDRVCSQCGLPAHECTCGRPHDLAQDRVCSQCGLPAHECNCGRPHELAQDRVCSQCGLPAHECTCGRPHDLAQDGVCSQCGHPAHECNCNNEGHVASSTANHAAHVRCPECGHELTLASSDGALATPSLDDYGQDRRYDASGKFDPTSHVAATETDTTAAPRCEQCGSAAGTCNCAEQHQQPREHQTCHKCGKPGHLCNCHQLPADDGNTVEETDDDNEDASLEALLKATIARRRNRAHHALEKVAKEAAMAILSAQDGGATVPQDEDADVDADGEDDGQDAAAARQLLGHSKAHNSHGDEVVVSEAASAESGASTPPQSTAAEAESKQTSAGNSGGGGASGGASGGKSGGGASGGASGGKSGGGASGKSKLTHAHHLKKPSGSSGGSSGGRHSGEGHSSNSSPPSAADVAEANSIVESDDSDGEGESVSGAVPASSAASSSTSSASASKSVSNAAPAASSGASDDDGDDGNADTQPEPDHSQPPLKEGLPKQVESSHSHSQSETGAVSPSVTNDQVCKGDLCKGKKGHPKPTFAGPGSRLKARVDTEEFYDPVGAGKLAETVRLAHQVASAMSGDDDAVGDDGEQTAVAALTRGRGARRHGRKRPMRVPSPETVTASPEAVTINHIVSASMSADDDNDDQATVPARPRHQPGKRKACGCQHGRGDHAPKVGMDALPGYVGGSGGSGCGCSDEAHHVSNTCLPGHVCTSSSSSSSSSTSTSSGTTSPVAHGSTDGTHLVTDQSSHGPGCGCSSCASKATHPPSCQCSTCAASHTHSDTTSSTTTKGDGWTTSTSNTPHPTTCTCSDCISHRGSTPPTPPPASTTVANPILPAEAVDTPVRPGENASPHIVTTVSDADPSADPNNCQGQTKHTAPRDCNGVEIRPSGRPARRAPTPPAPPTLRREASDGKDADKENNGVDIDLMSGSPVQTANNNDKVKNDAGSKPTVSHLRKEVSPTSAPNAPGLAPSKVNGGAVNADESNVIPDTNGDESAFNVKGAWDPQGMP